MNLPRRNLPPDAEAWGRRVSNLSTSNASRLSIAEQTLSNNLQGLNQTISKLSDQVQSLSEAQQGISDYTRRLQESTLLDERNIVIATSSSAPTPLAGPTFSFTKPSWATAAKVLATGSGTITGPLSMEVEMNVGIGSIDPSNIVVAFFRDDLDPSITGRYTLEALADMRSISQLTFVTWTDYYSGSGTLTYNVDLLTAVTWFE